MSPRPVHCLTLELTCAFALPALSACFFFNDTATTEIYTLSLHDALPICPVVDRFVSWPTDVLRPSASLQARLALDRDSTPLNSSHQIISHAVFCLEKKQKAPGVESKLLATDTYEHQVSILARPAPHAASP